MLFEMLLIVAMAAQIVSGNRKALARGPSNGPGSSDTLTPGACTCLCPYTLDAALSSCLGVWTSADNGTMPAFEMPTSVVSPTPSMTPLVYPSTWASILRPSVSPTASGRSFSGKSSTPSSSAEPVPAASSIAMTILTSNSTSRRGIDYFYTIPVRVGGQVLDLQLHTAASNTIVYTTQPNTTAANISLYVPPERQRPDRIQWKWSGQNVEEDGFSVRGNTVFHDSLAVHDGPVSVGQTLAIADADGNRLPEGVDADRSWDGILSLTRQNASLLFLNDGRNTRVPHASWFDNILPQLRHPVIGIALQRQATGFIDLGWTNDEMHAGAIEWAFSDSLEAGYWTVHVTSYRIGDEPVIPCDFDLQINTGSKYTTLDSSIVNEFRTIVALRMGTETLGDSAYYRCDTSLPSVTLTVDRVGGGSFDLHLPGDAFMLGENGDGTCEFGLVSMGGLDVNDFRGAVGLGIPALQTLYVVLNASGPSIGFAPQAQFSNHV
ncbi:Podosporapepsin [Talaromyces islandicus]|uniref:Podosporapepsin n=1 Tax=Talaromyces islandicus TaxID=28573 RepID=A0A0U1MCG6_TALIS|nr:Podosporapepsin [Talaromyces islandicus]